MGIQQALLGSESSRVVTPLAGGSVSSTFPDAAYVRIMTDGTIETTNGSGGSWFEPTTAGIGTGYYVNVSVDGDPIMTSPGAGWYELTEARYYAYEFFAPRSGTWTVSISSDASGTPVLTSGDFTVTVSS